MASNIPLITAKELSDRTFLPTEAYLPDWAKETEFFNDIVTLLNYTENSLSDYSNPKYAEVEQCYKDIIYKYKDIMQLSEDALKAMLIEHGFSAILDLFEMSLEMLQMFVLYLPLFKALKGTDVGYRQLLSMISYDYDIVTWLEDPEHLDEYTFNMTWITFLNVGFDSSILKKFIKFSRSYVYPVLQNLIVKVMFRQLAPAVYGRPLVTKDIKVRCFDGP
jgi:hypothetical protein